MLPTKKMSNKLNTSTPPLSAVEVAGNTDLLTEILIRLPIKPLIRFKSVSKLWLSLISDPKFSLLHRRPSTSSAAAGLFLERSNGEYDFYDIINTNPSRPPFKSLAFGSDNTSGLRIAQSCNGLLLCYDDSGSFCVFNPTTKRLTALPPPPPHSGSTASESCPYSLNLAFDPSESAHYKAICVRNFTGEDGQYQIDIYSSETGAWRPSSLGFFDSGLCYLFDRGVFWNGSVYWINAWGDFLRFEVDAERVHMIPMPPVPESLDLEDCYRDSGYLQVSGDSLHFIDRDIEPGASRFPVYEMERDGSGWFVKYEVDVSEVCKAFPEMIWRYDFDPEVDNYHLSVLCVVCCVVEEESYVLMNIVGKVLRYNFKDGSFCWLCDVPIVDSSEKVLNPCEVHPFIASLACV